MKMHDTSHDLLLFILCSPSGAGKTTLSRFLLEQRRDFTFSVSYTTRAPRKNEVDGVAYNFVARSTFEEKVAAGAFAEWAEVHGNLYGTSLAELSRARSEGKRGIVFDIDHQGARQIQATLPNAVSVFVLPPSMSTLRRRLEGRAADSADVIERRMNNARGEIAHYASFDYIIVNDDLEAAKQALVSITVAEEHRRQRQAMLAEALLRTERTRQ